MKYAMALAWGIALVSLSGFSQDAKSPKLDFERAEHDFGKIDKGSKVSTTFKFVNNGDAQLEIKDVSTSCGCTSAKPEKTSYAPGEAGQIPVTFNSGRFSGPITKRVTVVTNDPTNPRSVVTIKAEVIVDITVKPTSVFINKLKRGEKRTEELTISTERLDKLEITDVKAEQDYLTTEIDRVDDKTVKLKLHVDGTKIPSGETRLRSSISFNTNSESQNNIRTNVNVLVENPVSAQPSSVYMFGSKEGMPREVDIRLIASDDQKLSLGEITVDIQHSSPEAPNEKTPANIISTELVDDSDVATLKILLSDKASKGRFDGNIIIKTNIEEQPEVRIPIRGSVI